MNKIIIICFLILVGCNKNPVNSQGTETLSEEITEPTNSLYWMGDSDEPFLMTVNQSTLQSMWFFNTVTIDGILIEENDWVGAFNGDVCVGVKQWKTSSCGSNVCEIMLMGDDGNISWTLPDGLTDGYMKPGDIPTFKIYDTSEDEYYDAIPSEDIPWVGNLNWNILDNLNANR